MKTFCSASAFAVTMFTLLSVMCPTEAAAQSVEQVVDAASQPETETMSEADGQSSRRKFRQMFSRRRMKAAEEAADSLNCSKRRMRRLHDEMFAYAVASDSLGDGADAAVTVHFDGAHIEFDETVWDFGDVARKGGDVVKEFAFINNGSKPLVITGTTMSCTCIKADYSKHPIAAGERGVVRLIYEPHKMSPGSFYKVVQVHSNSVDGVRLLTVRGNSFDPRRQRTKQ